MEYGYGKHSLIVEISVDQLGLIRKLTELSDRASEVSALARSLIGDLRQEGAEEIQPPADED